MRGRISRWSPLVLTVCLVGALFLSLVVKTGEPALGREIREPAGPLAKPVVRPDRLTLEELAGFQAGAARHYRGVLMSYLGWRERVQRVSADALVFMQSDSRMCPAVKLVLPPRWCWYGSAWKWTLRELGETRMLIREQRERARWDRILGSWPAAVQYVQTVFPGTQSWLLSCSGAEGGHGRWVFYGGDGWSGYPRGDTVGGHMQFRPSTFFAYWPEARSYARDHGLSVPNLGSGYGPWLSPLGQAVTAGYMRYTGRDGHHWSASHGNGC